jgi:hypothetical protein
VKLNVDEPFHADSRAGSAGMDDGSAIILSSCRYLMTLPCIIEMNYLEGVSRIKSEAGDRSRYILSEGDKHLMHDGVGFMVEHIRRGRNFVSHALAAIVTRKLELLFG